MKERTFKICVIIFTIIVFLLVTVLGSKFLKHDNVPDYVYGLPKINAILNGTCFLLLIFSFIAIKTKKVLIHRNLNMTATLLSIIFFVVYIIYHYWVVETSYGGVGFMKVIYYFILITHVILSGIVLPMVLMSLYYALVKNFVKHKKIVKWTYPIWLYVTLTGVLVYIMLSPYYPKF